MMKKNRGTNTPKPPPRPSEKSETCARPRMRVSVERLVECCRRSNGIISAVAMMLGVDWHTADKYIKNCPEAQDAFQSARESILDVAESKLIQIVNNSQHPRNFEAIQFLLSTVAKKRGYTTKVEQEHSGIKAPPALNIVIEK